MFHIISGDRVQKRNILSNFIKHINAHMTTSVMSLLMLCGLMAAPAANAQSMHDVVADPDMLWGSEVPEGWTGEWPDELRTVGETSNFTRTPGIHDVHEFINKLKWRSENLHVFDVFETPMGHTSSAIVLSNPRISSPEEAKASGKPVIYLQNNIHPPESEGLDATMVLIRDILFGDKKHLLDNQIIIVLPMLNVDGTMRLTTEDSGPDIVGKRHDSHDNDLNREGSKLVTAEVQGMYENILNAWDPILMYDAHRMWEGNPAYGIACSHSTPPTGHAGPREYTFDNMFPWIYKRTREDYNIESFTHALWREREWPPKTYDYDETAWAPDVKFLVNAYGLRNRFGILCETPGGVSYERMVYTQYAWIASMLEYTNQHADEMMKIARDADEEVVRNVMEKSASGELRNWIDGEYVSRGEVDILVHRELYPFAQKEQIPGTSIFRRKEPSGPPEVVSGVEHYTKAVGTRDSWVPRAYVFGPELKYLAEKLENQGLTIKKLDEPVSVTGEQFVVDKMRIEDRGYPLTVLDGDFVKTTRKDYPAGSYWLDMAQPRANAAFYFLEPQSRDGMVAWWVLDDTLRELGAEERSIVYPIFKVATEIE